MISERVHPPKNIIQSQGHPTQWLIMAHVESRKHPAEIRPAEAAIVGVFYDIFVVVPIDKAVLQRRIKRGRRQGNDDDRYSPLEKPSAGFKSSLPA